MLAHERPVRLAVFETLGAAALPGHQRKPASAVVRVARCTCLLALACMETALVRPHERDPGVAVEAAHVHADLAGVLLVAAEALRAAVEIRVRRRERPGRYLRLCHADAGRRGHEHLLMSVDDPDLEARLLAALETLHSDAESIRAAMGRTVVDNLKRMARMGVYLERNVHEIYPEFPISSGVRSWDEYLPPLSPQLRKLIETYESRTQAVGAN